MTAKRLARQLYTKEWKRARREVLDVRALVRAQLDAEDAADRAEKSAQRRTGSREDQAVRCTARAGHAVQEADQQPRRLQHMAGIQPVETEEQPDELMGEPTSSVSRPHSSVAASPSTHAPNHQTCEDSSIEEQTSGQAVEGMTHDKEEEASDLAVLIKRMLLGIKEHMTRGMEAIERRLDAIERSLDAMERRLDAIERSLEAMERRMEGMEKKSEMLVAAVVSNLPQPQPPQQEEVLLGQCSTVEELEELDRSLSLPDRRNQMKRFLGRLGGANPGAAVRRILRQVATNQVLGQYSLRGRRAKKAFQNLALCKVIMEACMQNFPLMKVADVEEYIGHALKFAPHRRLTAPQDRTAY
ncbi:uncharacterized protein LOC134460210 isoform X1 [Engraulis encrasicolus]|uniref:uncharacterized protein LOC134460210 isoform X1 n=1 Tax=Engraulis encrasicolus TaxID=184585 RepID=UPI002FD32131